MRRLLVALAVALVVSTATAGCFRNVFGEPGPKDYVDSKTYTKWVIEVDAVQGARPDSAVFDLLRTRLTSVVDKPEGVELRFDDDLAARGGAWSARDIQAYSNDHLEAKTSGKTIVTHLLFLDGQSTQDDDNVRVLGVAIGYGTVAIFSDSIESTCTTGLTIPPSPPCTDPVPIYRAVVIHEFGHAMGLVDRGIPMVRNHEDPQHPGHSSNRNSVMYWAVENSDILNFFTGGPPTDFDDEDRADFCSAGGKC